MIVILKGHTGTRPSPRRGERPRRSGIRPVARFAGRPIHRFPTAIASSKFAKKAIGNDCALQRLVLVMMLVMNPA